jgi:hypothetical protein
VGLALLLGLGCGRDSPSDYQPPVRSAPSGPSTAKAIGPRGSPWLNVQPDVKYVGEQACAPCHAGHTQSFREHPMGQSLALVANSATKERYTAAARNPFKVGGIEYRVERQGERVLHSETVCDAQRQPLCSAEAEAKYVVGSGVSGRSYLIERDGFLFMSSITWYPRKGLWDLSPGYAVRNHHFTRPIMAECLFCHCNYAMKVSDTLNAFQPPIFHGHTIGCERCHGPGDLHVQARQRNDKIEGTDFTIVNPRRLGPELREAVCQQCHLQGQHRVLRRGTDTFDYRPGLPLQEFMSVFTRHPDLIVGNKFVGQVEQMYASRCFRKSDGRMGCISCHDPHVLPPANKKVAYYRQRCLNCHQEQTCSLPLPDRKRATPEDNCMQCHMPVSEANITHTAFSDHRILREPAKESPSPARRPPPGQLPLVAFHKPRDADEEQSVDRDLAIALMMMTENHPEGLQQELARQALPRLERARPIESDDLPAWEAQANALWILGQRQEAAELFESLLTRSPRFESALGNAASLATEMRRHRAALKYWERACSINPYRWRYRLGLATVHARAQDWGSALYECRCGLRLHPMNKELRQLAVTCQLALGDSAAAQADLEILVALEPQEAEQLRAWYAAQQRTP